MADQKLRELTETTAPVSTDLLYSVVDPGGTPLDRKVDVGTLLGNLGAWQNLVKNSPGQIPVDGAEPQWWDDVTNATITDEDTAGEAIPDSKGERVFKVVTTADDVYGYQSFTFSDESLLDAGVTVVSFSCWVYCASANKASIGIYGTNLGLEESAQAGAGAWGLLTVENITLDAADTAIQARLIVDTGTAYFAMPMLNIGSCSLPWCSRRQRFVARTDVAQINLVGTGDVAWTDSDCTANTHPLAVAVAGRAYVTEPDGTAGSTFYIGHSDNIVGADTSVLTSIVQVLGQPNNTSGAYIVCDDGQNIRYYVGEVDADNDVTAVFTINGYWRWE